VATCGYLNRDVYLEGDFHCTTAHNGAPRVPADTQATHYVFPSYAQCPILAAITAVLCEVQTRWKRLMNESSSDVPSGGA